MTRRQAGFALVAVVWPWRAVGQTPVSARDLDAAVARLSLLVGTVRARSGIPGQAPSALLLATRFENAVRWLQNNASKSDPGRVTAEYVQSLERAASIVVQNADLAVLDDVTRELEAKVTHCQRLEVGMGGAVTLRVNTRRAGAVVPNWQVQYLLKFDEWLKTPPRTFPRVSSPTEARVEPGRYWIWARDPASGRTGQRVLVEVAGTPELLVDVAVP